MKKSGGKLPSQDKPAFARILDLVIENWKLTKPVDLMMANRMVSTFMKLRYAEEKAEKIGLILDTHAGIKMNPVLGYCRDLQNDLMRFYRMFQGKSVDEKDGPQDFAEWIDDNTEKVKQEED